MSRWRRPVLTISHKDFVPVCPFLIFFFPKHTWRTRFSQQLLLLPFYDSSFLFIFANHGKKLMTGAADQNHLSFFSISFSLLTTRHQNLFKAHFWVAVGLGFRVSLAAQGFKCKRVLFPCKPNNHHSMVWQCRLALIKQTAARKWPSDRKCCK